MNDSNVLTRQFAFRAQDGDMRHVTVVMMIDEGMDYLKYGVSIATPDCFDAKLGEQIAHQRAVIFRENNKEKGLVGRIYIGRTHRLWLQDNRKMLHRYADYIREQVKYQLNDIIWTDEAA